MVEFIETVSNGNKVMINLQIILPSTYLLFLRLIKTLFLHGFICAQMLLSLFLYQIINQYFGI